MTIVPNILVNTDALSLLERLQDNSVDLIYLDPPWKSQFLTNSPVSDNFYNYIYKVIQQSHRILKETGNLFFYSSPELNTDFQSLFQRQFGLENFVYEYIIPVRRGTLSNSTLQITHHTLFHYKKSNNQFFNSRIIKVEEAELEKIYPYTDERGRYRLLSLSLPEGRKDLDFVWRNVKPEMNRFWRYSKEKLDQLYKDKEILLRDDGRYHQKRYLTDEDRYMSIGTIWNDIPAVDFKQKAKGSQAEELMNRILQIGSLQGSVVLDPFCGSGSMPVAAIKAGRKIIACDSSLMAIDNTLSRLRSLAPKFSNLLDTSHLLNLPIIFDNYQPLAPTVEDELIEIILKGENNLVEFKESALWNFNLSRRDPTMIDNVLKAIAAFANSHDGGQLILGVRNDKTQVDLTIEYELVDPSKRDRDGYELFLNNKIRSTLGPNILGKYSIQFYNINSCELCQIVIIPSKSPIFFNKKFFLRNGNQSLNLTNEDFFHYLQNKHLA